MREHFCCFTTRLTPAQVSRQFPWHQITAVKPQYNGCAYRGHPVYYDYRSTSTIPYNYWKVDVYCYHLYLFFTVYTISESGQDLFSMQIITVKKILLENIDITLNNPNKYITNIYRIVACTRWITLHLNLSHWLSKHAQLLAQLVGLREELKHSALIGVLWSRKMPHTHRKVNEILHGIKPGALRKP